MNKREERVKDEFDTSVVLRIARKRIVSLRSPHRKNRCARLLDLSNRRGADEGCVSHSLTCHREMGRA